MLSKIVRWMVFDQDYLTVMLVIWQCSRPYSNATDYLAMLQDFWQFSQLFDNPPSCLTILLALSKCCHLS